MIELIKKIILPILVVTVLCSCAPQTASSAAEQGGKSSSEENVSDESKPEALFYRMIADKRDGKLTGERLWTAYLSEKSKSLGIIAMEEFISQSDANRSQDTIKGYALDGVKILDDPKYAILSYKITTSSIYGEEKVTVYEDPLIFEDGKWKLLLLGIYDIHDYPREVDDKGLSISSVSVRYTVSGILVSYSVSNRTDKTYSIGWSDMAEMSLKTDVDSYSIAFKESVKLSPGADYTSSFFFSGAKGKVEKLSLNRLYELNEEDISPAEGSKSQTINRELKEDAAEE